MANLTRVAVLVGGKLNSKTENAAAELDAPTQK